MRQIDRLGVFSRHGSQALNQLLFVRVVVAGANLPLAFVAHHVPDQGLAGFKKNGERAGTMARRVDNLASVVEQLVGFVEDEGSAQPAP